MKNLFLVRHAKSSWEFNHLKDWERPLNERGTSDAPMMGRALNSRGVRPDMIATSPALRATSTAMAIAEEIGLADIVQTDPRLYHSYAGDLLKLIKSLPKSIHSAMLVGHNPSFTDLANHLIPDEIDNIPTCGIVAIAFQTTDWSKIERNSGQLMFFEYPKKHKRQ